MTEQIDITNHTPTPWKLFVSRFRKCHGIYTLDGTFSIILAEELETLGRTQEEHNANAAFIVTACNSYDDNQATIARQAERISHLEKSRLEMAQSYTHELIEKDKTIKALVDALEEVEFLHRRNSYGDSEGKYCPICAEEKDDGHAANCNISIALKLAKGE